MLNSIQFWGALSSGMIYALVAFAVYLSFRVLDFPDLTVDGSFPLGAAVATVAIVQGWNPYLALVSAFVAGACAGSLTAFLHVRWRIMGLLASILVMTALHSVNLRIMGKPNLSLYEQVTILSAWKAYPSIYVKALLFTLIAGGMALLLWWFLRTEIGLALRATGANPDMARAQGIRTGAMLTLGMALSNALVALAGGLMAQSQAYADVQMGLGTIVIGLAALIGGEALLQPKNILRALLACILGAVAYRLAIALALNAKFLGLKTQDFNLITALIVTLAIVLSDKRFRLGKKA